MPGGAADPGRLWKTVGLDTAVSGLPLATPSSITSAASLVPPDHVERVLKELFRNAGELNKSSHSDSKSSMSTARSISVSSNKRSASCRQDELPTDESEFPVVFDFSGVRARVVFSGVEGLKDPEEEVLYGPEKDSELEVL
jgi:hypothetical protein